MAINMTTDSVLPPTMAPIYLNIVGMLRIGSQSGFQCQWMCSIWSKSRFSAKMTIFDLIYDHKYDCRKHITIYNGTNILLNGR